MAEVWWLADILGCPRVGLCPDIDLWHIGRRLPIMLYTGCI